MTDAGPSRLRYAALALASLAILGNYYVYDSIALNVAASAPDLARMMHSTSRLRRVQGSTACDSCAAQELVPTAARV